MTYTVTTTAGSTVATINDGTINTTATSLTLIGKNYAGYGIFLNENYVQLLENFSNSTPPSAPLTGQLWYDNVNDILKVYNAANNIWKPISSSISQSTAPSAAISVTGDIWWDTTNAQLKVWSGSAWITIGPSYTSTSGTSGPVTESILDNSGSPHVVTKFYIASSVIAILSKDATFTPQTAIPGFTTIIPGLNLISQSTLAGAQFTGATTGASTLGGLTASQFLRSDISQTTSYAFGAAGGLTVGSDLTFDTSSGTAVIAETTNNRNIRIDVNKSGVTTPALTINATTNTLQVGNAISVTGPSLLNGGATVTGAITGTSTLNVAGNILSTGAIHNSLTVNGVTTHSGNIAPASNNVAYLGSASNRYNTIYGVNIDVLSLTSGGGTAFTALNTTGNVLAQAGVFNALTVNGNETVTGYINVTGNVLAQGGVFNALAVNGNETVSGYLNVTGNVLSKGAVHNSLTVNGATSHSGDIVPTANNAASLGSGTNRYSTLYVVNLDALSLSSGGGTTLSQLNTTGNVLSQGGVFNSLTVNGSETVTGTVTAGQLNTTGNILATGGILNALTVNGVTTKLGALNMSTGSNISVTGAWLNAGTVNVTGNILTKVATIGTLNVTNDFVPGANAAVSLGSAVNRFNYIYGVYGNFLSVQANYADLAERFEADVPMVPGTVVELGGIKEITAAVQELSEDVFGVISTTAGFLLNGSAGTNSTHPPVAVNGRVPVRVIGAIKKGDRLVSAGNGLARAAKKGEYTAFNVIGRALENKETTEEGTVEAIVKLNS